MQFFYPFKHPLQQELGRSAVVVMPVLMVQPLFGIWMLYQAIRHETKPCGMCFWPRLFHSHTFGITSRDTGQGNSARDSGTGSNLSGSPNYQALLPSCPRLGRNS